MNDVRICFLAILLYLLSPSTLMARTKEMTREISILAPISCDAWLDARKARTRVKPTYEDSMGLHINQMWLLGLLTGLNANYLTTKNLLANVDSTLAFDWMDKYCAKDGAEDVYRGAKEFLDVIDKRSKL